MTQTQQVSVYSDRLAPGHSGNLLTCPACRPIWLAVLAFAALVAWRIICS